MKALQQIKVLGFLVLTTVLASSLASAERYMVVLKNRQTFAQVHAQLMLQENMNLASVRIQANGQVQKPFANTEDVIVDSSLENLNTVVVEVEDASELAALESSGQVLMVEKEIFHPSPKPVQGFKLTKAWDFSMDMQPASNFNSSIADPVQPWGISAVGAPQAWKAGARGQGTRVLVLDTGVDRDHPALKNQLEEGMDFYGGPKTPYEYADLEGHGTHVAGTILAQHMTGGFVGVAPEARLLMGRVCGEMGCSNIAVAKGINWGISKKVDVINMSLGGPIGSPAEKRAVEAADKAGIVVVAASGNDGKAKVSFPAAFPTVLAVGATDSNTDKANFSNWGPELDIVAPGVNVISSVPMGSGRESIVEFENKVIQSTSFVGSSLTTRGAASNELVAVGLGKPEDYKNVVVRGKFAYIQRGEISFVDKAKNAVAAGAVGIVIYNNNPTMINGAVTDDGSTLSVPVVLIEQKVGEAIAQRLKAGESIRLSLQVAPRDYAAFAGTSMASPHVAGVVALVKSANNRITTAEVRDLLKRTAKALTPNSSNEFGSGLVSAERAVTEASSIR